MGVVKRERAFVEIRKGQEGVFFLWEESVSGELITGTLTMDDKLDDEAWRQCTVHFTVAQRKLPLSDTDKRSEIVSNFCLYARNRE